MSLKPLNQANSHDDSIEQTTRFAQRHLFSRFILTLILCFIVIQLIVTGLLIYQQHFQANQMMMSLKQEYQRLLVFESDEKLEHVLASYPDKLMSNTMSVIRLNDKREQFFVAGVPVTQNDIPVAEYLLSQSDWLDFLFAQPYLTVKLNPEPTDKGVESKQGVLKQYKGTYWLVLHVPTKLGSLVEKWLLIAAVLGVLSLLICFIVWRLLRTSLQPLHVLARGLDKYKECPHGDYESRSRIQSTMTLSAGKGVKKNHKGLEALNQSVNQVMCSLEEANLSMSHTLDAIAHDLRTPLSRILLSTEKVLVSDSRSEDDARLLRSTLSDCAESALQANKLLTTLMKINDEVIGRNCIIKESVSIQTLVTNVLSWYEEIAEEQGIELVLKATSDLYCYTEPKRLTQVLVNLVDNSIKYSERGDEVSVSWAKEDGFLCIRVKDTGIGIEKDKHQAIFERLYRVDHSRSQVGYGLGLAIVNVMLDSLGASISLISELGQGSEFCVSLPLQNTQSE